MIAFRLQRHSNKLLITLIFGNALYTNNGNLGYMVIHYETKLLLTKVLGHMTENPTYVYVA